MTTERDPSTRIVLSWLREDSYENAERVLLRALDEVDTTPQRRSWWPARRFSEMNRYVRAAIAAAAVVAVAITTYSLLPRSGVGGPGPSPTPTASPIALHLGPLEAGTYVAHPLAAPLNAMSFTFTVPDGWQGVGPEGSASLAVAPAVGTEGPTGAAMVILHVTGLYADPCHGNTAPPVSVGDTVADLVSALGQQDAYETTAPAEVALGGYSGERMDLLVPSDLDFATCEGGAFWVWENPPHAQGPGNRWQLWILDVDGVRVVILAEDFATTSAENQAALQAIVQSVRIEP